MRFFVLQQLTFTCYFTIIFILETNACKIQIVESLPEGLVYPDGSPSFPSTYDAWTKLIEMANDTMDIGSLYWTLRGADEYNHSTAWQGEHIFKDLLNAGTNRGVHIRIVEAAPTKDTEIFLKQNAAKVRRLDLKRLLGNGVLHSKIWIVDDQHMYVGSANFDWRSLTQIKELGVLITNCPILVSDASKIFNVYWDMGKENAVLPSIWAKEYSTRINASNPVTIKFTNGFKMNTYLSSAPPAFSPIGRSHDIDAILNIIKNAKTFIHISLMDYIPMWEFRKEQNDFWPVIDDALREAAINRRVSVKLLISWWKNSHAAADYFLQSLKAISNVYQGVDIQVKRFICSATEDQSKIPFARVNHNKYMVTENVAYIGTSNWSADYFTDTAGIGLILEESDTFENNETVPSIRSNLARIFERDWNSQYTHDLETPKTN